MEKLVAVFNKPTKKKKQQQQQQQQQQQRTALLHQPRGDLVPAAAQPAAPPFPAGIQVLHDCADAALDICFVHGLTGDRTSTWTAAGQGAPWPQTLLPARLPGARVLSFGYDAYLVRRRAVASSSRVVDHAASLVNDLVADRAACGAADRPLVLVAHSLGGLVCKAALLRSRNDPEAHLRTVFACAKGVVFMGTPHRGSWMAVWSKIPAASLGFVKSTNRGLLEVLATDNQLLEAIQVDFWSMVREAREAGRRLHVTCFFEELPLPMVGKIVSKTSATLEGYSALGIHANHSDMVKFASADDSGFQRLLGELARWASEIQHAAAEAPAHEAVQQAPAPTPSFNSYGGTQNNNTGPGNLFSGTSFSGPVQFGHNPP